MMTRKKKLVSTLALKITHPSSRHFLKPPSVRLYRFGLMRLTLVVIFLSVAALKATANVTYSYAGNPFTTIGGNIGVTGADHISITFSLATPLGPNLNCANVETNGAGLLLSFNISDGVHSFGLGPNTQLFCISTSSTGQITQWIAGNSTAGSFPFIVSTNIPATGNENDVVAFTATDFASVRNNPGTWSTGSAQTPPNTVVQICLGRSSPGPNFCDGGNDEVAVHATSVSINDTFGSSAVGEQLTGAAAGTATFGVLKASSSASFDLSGTGHAFSHAISTFEDAVTIIFPGLNGSGGTLVVNYTLAGNVASSGTAVGLGIVGGNVNGRPFIQEYQSPASGVFTAGTFPFIYGQPFPLLFQLSADSGTILANGTAADICVFCTGSGLANADFSNTFVLSGFEVLDPNGNPLPSPPTITSSSGTQYGLDGVLTSFASLSVTDLDFEADDKRFQIKGSFRLGTNSNGIDPLNEDVALQIGEFSAVVPAGSFKLFPHGDRDDDQDANRDDHKRYIFKGTINGLRLEIQIRSTDEGEFRFQAAGRGEGLTQIMKPVKVRLMIGDDGGTATASADSNSSESE